MSREYEEMQGEKWVNLEDVAEHLSISQDTVRTWIKEGKLPVYRAGKRYKFKIFFWSIYQKPATILIVNCICLSKTTKSASRACGFKIGPSKPLFNNNSLVAGIFNCISRPALLSG